MRPRVRVPASSDSDPAGRGIRNRILLVADAAHILDGVDPTPDEWETTTATYAEEALSVLEDRDHDLLIAPPLEPLFSMLQASELLANLPVIALVPATDRQARRSALDLGALDVLSADADPEEVLARIHCALRIKEYEDEIHGHAQHLEQIVGERTAELELAQAELIWRLGRAGEYRDQETGNHVIRVGLFSKCIAENMGLDAGFAHKIFLTSPLHDLGKIGIPDSILLKPGKLNEHEWRTMQGHAAIGAGILRDEIVTREYVARLGLASVGVGVLARNPFREMAAQIAESHHERWDGQGYPVGLAGEDIPLAARITTVADVYDALCSKRPYKEAFVESEALAIMRRGNGTQFDPNVFAAFEKSLEEFRTIRSEFDDAQESPTPADLMPSLSDLREAS